MSECNERKKLQNQVLLMVIDKLVLGALVLLIGLVCKSLISRYELMQERQAQAALTRDSMIRNTALIGDDNPGFLQAFSEIMAILRNNPASLNEDTARSLLKSTRNCQVLLDRFQLSMLMYEVAGIGSTVDEDAFDEMKEFLIELHSYATKSEDERGVEPLEMLDRGLRVVSNFFISLNQSLSTSSTN